MALPLQYEKLFKESKTAAQFINKLSFLSPDHQINFSLCVQIFEKNGSSSPSASCEFDKIFKILKKCGVISGGKENGTVGLDKKFHLFLRENQLKNFDDNTNLLELANTLKLIVVGATDLSFDIIPHVDSVRKILRDESGHLFDNSNNQNVLKMRIKCWWSARQLSGSHVLRKVDKAMAGKLDKVYTKNIEILTERARKEQILKNFEIFEPHEKLYEISLADYANSIYQILIEWGHKCPKIKESGVTTLGGLGRINILPEKMTNEILDYASAYEEDGWDNFFYFLAKSKLYDNEEGLQKISKDYVQNINLEFKRREPIKGDRWKRIWTNLNNFIQDRRMGKLVQVELTIEKGVKVMTKAFGVNNANPDFDLSTWSRSQGLVLEITRSLLDRECPQVELFQSKKFIGQVTSFLPRLFLQFRDNILTLSAWKIIEPYSAIILKMSDDANILEKMIDLRFLNSIKSTLQIISTLKAPTEFGEDMVKNKFRLYVFALLFSTLGKLEDVSRAKILCQDFKVDLDGFDNGGRIDKKIWPWSTIWIPPLKNFVEKMNLATSTDTVQTAVKISQKLIEALEA